MKNFTEFLIEERRTNTIDKIQKLFDEELKGTSFSTDVGLSGAHSFELKHNGKDIMVKIAEKFP